MEPGKLVVAIVGEGTGLGDRSAVTSSRVYLVDTASGEVRQIGAGLLPVYRSPIYTRLAPGATPSAGSEATKLFYGYGPHGRTIVHLDPATGEQHLLLGRAD